MSTSIGVNVLRYSALAFGVFYGISHQAAITASFKLAEIDNEYHQKEKLIQKAKLEYVKRTTPSSSKTSSGSIISDPNNPNFDFEAYLTQAAAESPAV